MKERELTKLLKIGKRMKAENESRREKTCQKGKKEHEASEKIKKNSKKVSER